MEYPHVCALGLSLLAATATAQSAKPLPEPIAPLAGSVLLGGGGVLPDRVFEAFARLAGGGAAQLVLIGDGKVDATEQRLRGLGVASMRVLRLTGASQIRTESVLAPLLEATGAWLASDVPALSNSALFGRILRSILARGGVVGGSGSGARLLARFRTQADKRSVAGLDVLPRAVVEVGFATGTSESRLLDHLQHNPGCVGWGIPEGTALLVDGRRVCVVGEKGVTALVAPRNGWPERRMHLDRCPFTKRWDELPYTADLLSWTRSARVRCGEVFPPKVAPAPSLAKGTLVLSGGSGVGDAVFDRFIAAAGGKDAVFVCIPTADSIPETSRASFSARKLRDRGCKHVHVLHTRSRGKANHDRELLTPLRMAGGVWIDGGRTYRLMDAYEDTQVERLMHEVLRRGGVIGGSSAGCQVQGDFLMRGRPGSNKELSWEGYTTGFGFLGGVVVDAHFRQRNRQKTFPELLRIFPQMLGIGIDEKTALVVRGQVGEVLGPNAVTFFDFRGRSGTEVVLRAGQKYDLVARKRAG
ncbi:MAG: Type 1 glutamine amidotransferase-like domain-containing protein [Planctomycetes bacterium]|nr:Type 1 glutamine amidotransferase-like domain-containing protein [Planctomycetota bacterium]